MKKINKKLSFNIICVLVLLFVSALLVACKSEQNQNLPITGGDSDSHGCKASAGYSWCEEKQKCYRSFEENCTTSNIETTTTSTTTNRI